MWQELVPFEKTELNLTFKSKAWLEGGMLKVAYELIGDIDQLLLPDPLLSPGRVIGLWESTCFEMFIKNGTDEQYLEFNVSSEYNWNVFHFPNKKARLKEYQGISNLGVSAVTSEKNFCLSYWIPLDKLPSHFWMDGNMNIGLTAVVESKQGTITHWALKHADTKPNFHHEDSFIFHL